MVCSGLKIFRCSGRPSTLVIIISQRGNQPLPNLKHTFRPGLGGPCPIKARPWLLTLLPCPRSGTFATFSPSRDGRRSTSPKPFSPSSGLGRRISLSEARSACLPRSQGGFGVINFEQKAQAFALQWIKRYFDPEWSKWKNFFTFFEYTEYFIDKVNTKNQYASKR